jgi:hypothetical protein
MLSFKIGIQRTLFTATWLTQNSIGRPGSKFDFEGIGNCLMSWQKGYNDVILNCIRERCLLGVIKRWIMKQYPPSKKY